MITIESIRTTRDLHISNNPQTWERYPVTYITVKDYDMDAPMDEVLVRHYGAGMDCRPHKILEDVIVKHGDNGQTITDYLCEKHGLEKHRYTNHAVV